MKMKRKRAAKALEYMTNTKLFMPFFIAALQRVLTITSINCDVNIAATTRTSSIVLCMNISYVMFSEKYLPLNTILFISLRTRIRHFQSKEQLFI